MPCLAHKTYYSWLQAEIGDQESQMQAIQMVIPMEMVVIKKRAIKINHAHLLVSQKENKKIWLFLLRKKEIEVNKLVQRQIMISRH